MVKKHTAASALPPEASQAFQAQFRHAKRLPAQVHRAAYALATRAGDQPLLTLLVARPDAPADLFESYRSLSDIPLRVAFLTRPGHDPEFLRSEISSEKRAGVLKALVAPGTSAEVTASIAAVFLERPTRALAEALVHVSSELSIPARMKVVEVLGSRYGSLTQTNAQALKATVRSLASSSPLVASQAALLVSEPELASFFLDLPGLDLPARLSIVKTALAGILDTPGFVDRNGSRTYYGGRAVQGVIASASRLLAVPDLQPEVVEAISALGTHALVTAQERRLLESRVAARGANAAAVSKSSRDTLLELVQKGDEAAQVQVVTSDSFTLEERIATLGRMRNFSPLVPAAPRLPGDLLDELYVRAAEEMVKAHGFSLYPDPVAAQVALVRKAAVASESTRSSYNYWYGTPLTSLLRTGALAPEALSAFPWAFVRALSSPYTYSMDVATASLLEHVADLQAAAFGDVMACWETFAILSGDFSGTVGELVEMVATLSPEV